MFDQNFSSKQIFLSTKMLFYQEFFRSKTFSIQKVDFGLILSVRHIYFTKYFLSTPKFLQPQSFRDKHFFRSKYIFFQTKMSFKPRCFQTIKNFRPKRFFNQKFVFDQFSIQKCCPPKNLFNKNLIGNNNFFTNICFKQFYLLGIKFFSNEKFLQLYIFAEYFFWTHFFFNRLFYHLPLKKSEWHWVV